MTVPVLNPVLFPASPEGGLIDSKYHCSLLQRLRGCKNPTDMLLLDLFYWNGVTDIWSPLIRNEVWRETLQADPVGSAKDGRPLNDVAQFPDIARPVIPLENLEGVLSETDEGPVIVPGIERQ